jgi:putative hydrolase of the HAD superfamily
MFHPKLFMDRNSNEPINMYQHLFFDLDHTLWDFEQNSKNTMQQLYITHRLEGRGITDFEAFYAVYRAHNEKLWERFRKGFIKRDELRWKRMWHTLLDFKVGDTKIANELSVAYLEILPTQRALMPHAIEVLDYCKTKEYSMHIITNGFDTTQRQKLHYCGIATYFDQLISSEKSNSMKPKKEIFDFALQATNAQPESSIMIGDALEIDIAGAMSAGWDQIYFNPEKMAHTRKPTYEITSLKEIIGIL